jgi:hypothetical protein
LELSESLDFEFLLGLGSSDLLEMLFLSLGFGSVVIHNFLLKLFLFVNSLVLDVDGFLVSDFNFSHKDCSLLEFLLLLSSLFFLEILNLLLNELFFAFLNFSVGNPLHFSFFDLVDDDEGALSLGVLPLDFSLLLVFQTLESLNFHHQVQTLLLSTVLLLKALLLFQLPISDGHTLSVNHHLVHVFHIVLLLVQLSLCLFQN